METIGVTTIDPWFVLDDEPLIKDLFYFDKLVYYTGKIETLEKFCKTLPNGENKFVEKIKEIERLEKFGLISEFTEDSFLYELLTSDDDQAKHYAFKSFELAVEFSTNDKPFNDVFLDFLERFREVGQLRSRTYSIILNGKNQNTYTPIIRNDFYNFSIGEFNSTTTVLTVLLKRFPMITNEIEIEKFIDFKNDPETKLKLNRLKDWVIDISKKSYSGKEIEQKIDYLLQEYSNQLELHKLRYKLGVIETLVTTTLGILENLVKVNFSKAAKVIFDLKKQDINLLEAEQKTTGRELAYIYKLENINRL